MLRGVDRFAREHALAPGLEIGRVSEVLERLQRVRIDALLGEVRIDVWRAQCESAGARRICVEKAQ